MAIQSSGTLNLTGIDPVQQSIASVSTQVVVNESLTIASIAGLQQELNAKENITDLTNNYYNIASIDGQMATVNASITGVSNLV